MEGWSKKDIIARRKSFFEKYKNFFVFDIETVKDESMFDNIANDKEKERDSNGEFLSVPFHKIVAISFMIVKDGNIETFESFSSQNEFTLLNYFWNNYKKAHSFSQNRSKITRFPVLVSVNGKDFDMPVIKLRSLKYPDKIQERFFMSIYMDRFDRWEDNYPRYTNRYTPYHIDIPVDIFGRKISLKNLCYLCGIPVKQEGEGGLVQEYYQDGDLEKIAKYCAEDVKATALLFSYINRYLLDCVYNFPDFEEILKINPEVNTV